MLMMGAGDLQSTEATYTRGGGGSAADHRRNGRHRGKTLAAGGVVEQLREEAQNLAGTVKARQQRLAVQAEKALALGSYQGATCPESWRSQKRDILFF
jgi:hypothetical protein